MNYRIFLQWDNEAAVWIATSDDIPGLVLESGSLDGLIERVKFAAPELIELNHLSRQGFLDFSLARREMVFA